MRNETHFGRRDFLRLACASGFGTALGAAAIEHSTSQWSGRHPNIVFLLADQWRAKATGYAGDPNVKTPHLDHLAGESINFINAVSVLPVCTPYRAALMTGRFPTSTGMFLNDAYLPDAEVCIAEVLKVAGYATAYIGKWHLDGHGRSAFIPPARRQGWDLWKAAECDHNYNHSHFYTGTSAEKHFWEGYDAFAQTRDAQAYLHQRAQTGGCPFALFVSYGPPHFPHATAPQEYKDMYPPESITLPPNVPDEQQAAARREAQGYYAHCTALDKCVGDIVATLEETGLAGDTIFVFTSDHGEMLGSHGVRPSLKQVSWDESARVPCLLRFPSAHGRRSRTVKAPLTTPDLMPTLLGLAGIAAPPSAEGEDLSAIVRNGPEPARAALYMNVSPFSGEGDERKEYRAIRTSRHSYVRNIDGPWRLFDDELDPYQMNNLVGKPECASLLWELDARLQAELKKINDDFRPARTYTAEWGYNVKPGGNVPYNPWTGVQSPKRRSSGKVRSR